MRAVRTQDVIVGLRELVHCFTGTGSCCRFDPVCSSYAKQAFKEQGWILGIRLVMGRLLRCHPWGGHGYDPVPHRNGFSVSARRNSLG